MIQDMLYPYQEVAVAALTKRRRQAILDEPGLGKTIMVLGALERDNAFQRPYRALVLATTTGAALTWLPTAERLLPENVVVLPAFKGLLSRRRKLAALHAEDDAPLVVIANHAYIELAEKDLKDLPDLFGVAWDAIIIDESQRVLPTKATADRERTRFWRGLANLKTSGPSALRIAMSGTPDRGKLENRYGMWAFLLPERFNFTELTYPVWLYQNFRLRFKQVRVKVRGRVIEMTETIPGAVKDPAAWAAIDDVMTIRRTKAEVAAWLPPKRYLDIFLPLPSKLEKAYLAYQEEFSATEDDGTYSAADTFRVRATQFAICEWDVTKVGHGTKATPILGSASPIRDWLIEWLQEREYDVADSALQSKVVITSQFSAILRWLHEELALCKIPSAILDGSLPTSARLAVQQDFQSAGGTRVVLLNMSLGDSIDLDAADDMIFVDLVNDPDKTTQTEDRIHRVSRDHNVFIWRLIVRGTVVEAILRANESRFDTTRESLDGRRGIDYARTILARLKIGESHVDA